MVTVAKTFEAPIKVIWPKNEVGFALLGLGDIVIPGIFISMMLRFDRYLAKKRKTKSNNLYFYTCFISYILALIVTVTVLHFFEHGQVNSNLLTFSLRYYTLYLSIFYLSSHYQLLKEIFQNFLVM
jgi:hypothetical protein